MKKLYRIKKVLKTIGKSQVWLSSELEISKQYVNDMCNDRIYPNSVMLDKIARKLEVSIYDLIEPNGFRSVLDPESEPLNRTALEKKIDTLQRTVTILQQTIKQQNTSIRELKVELRKLSKS